MSYFLVFLLGIAAGLLICWLWKHVNPAFKVALNVTPASGDLAGTATFAGTVLQADGVTPAPDGTAVVINETTTGATSPVQLNATVAGGAGAYTTTWTVAAPTGARTFVADASGDESAPVTFTQSFCRAPQTLSKKMLAYFRKRFMLLDALWLICPQAALFIYWLLGSAMAGLVFVLWNVVFWTAIFLSMRAFDKKKSAGS